MGMGYKPIKPQEVAQVLGGFGEMKSNGGTQYFQQDRVYSTDGFALCHPANIPGGSYRYLVMVNG